MKTKVTPDAASLNSSLLRVVEDYTRRGILTESNTVRTLLGFAIGYAVDLDYSADEVLAHCADIAAYLDSLAAEYKRKGEMQ